LPTKKRRLSPPSTLTSRGIAVRFVVRRVRVVHPTRLEVEGQVVTASAPLALATDVGAAESAPPSCGTAVCCTLGVAPPVVHSHAVNAAAWLGEAAVAPRTQVSERHTLLLREAPGADRLWSGPVRELLYRELLRFAPCLRGAHRSAPAYARALDCPRRFWGSQRSAGSASEEYRTRSHSCKSAQSHRAGSAARPSRRRAEQRAARRSRSSGRPSLSAASTASQPP
jgi:hypothetical protein